MKKTLEEDFAESVELAKLYTAITGEEIPQPQTLTEETVKEYSAAVKEKYLTVEGDTMKRLAAALLEYVTQHGKVSGEATATKNKNRKQPIKKNDRAELPRQNYMKPDAVELLNTKVADVVFSPKLRERIADAENPLEAVASGPEKKKPIISRIYLTTNEQENYSLSKPLTSYDNAVLAGVNAIYEGGSALMTDAQIYEAFAGGPTRSKTALQEVAESMKKLAGIWIHADVTEHLKDINPEIDDAQYTYDGQVVYWERLTFESNGYEVKGYHILRKPWLLEYSQLTRQVISVQREMLDIPTISNTKNSVLIKLYLLKRIELMKNEHNKIKSDNILYDTMITELELNASTEQEKIRIRSTVDKILKHWEDKKYIKSHKEYKKGRTLAGVTIVYKF